jgi:predicted dehydrogenase
VRLYVHIARRAAGLYTFEKERERDGLRSPAARSDRWLSGPVQSDAAIVRPPVERETIHIGVIGAGFGASVHVPSLQRVPGVAVVAICGTRRERVHSAAHALGIPGTFTDYREMLASPDIDAITIAAPPHLHHAMSLAACEAGKHILCEKPMARNVAEARDMLRMAREAGVCHAVAFQLRHDPARAEMKRLLDDDYIGALQSVTVRVYRSTLADPTRRTHAWLTDAARSGGILGAIGSHYIDALRWWFGDIHAACGAVSTAVTQRLVHGSPAPQPVDADDNTAFVLRFANGGLGSVHLCYTAATDIGEEILATGSEGMLSIQDDGMLVGMRRGEQIQSILPPGRTTTESTEGQSEGTARHIRAFTILAAEWVLAMRTGTDASPSFEDGAKVQEVVDAVTRSQQLSRWVDLSGNKWPV